MRFLSVCSGIEAASAAWLPLGWECVAVAEIEKFPNAVLAHHYPSVPNLGDITKITEAQIKALGHIDLVVGGFPCQDLSVAGKRAGLENEDGSTTRSGLFFTAMQVVGWSGARWTVIENVPGLFSSKQGRDFAAVVGALAGCEFGIPPEGWKNMGAAVGPAGLVEWCVLDAQFAGVPQRRRRVFLVRDTGDWTHRPPVLFECHSLQRHSPPSREKRESPTYPIAPCIGASGRGFERTGDTRGNDAVIAVHCAEIAHSLRAEGFDASEDETGRGTPLVPTFIHLNKGRPDGRKSTHTEMVTLETETIPTLATDGHAQSAIAFSSKDSGADAGETSPTLRAMGHAGSHANAGGQVAIAFNHQENRSFVASSSTNPLRANQTEAIAIQDDTTSKISVELNGALRRDAGGEGACVGYGGQTMQVRRLTSRECERLQGFPDDYTLIPFTHGKPAADGPRYKALGNSMAVPVMRHIGERIQLVDWLYS